MITYYRSSICFSPYPQCHRSHPSSGCVHWGHGTPAVTVNVISLHVVEAGIVIQTADSVDGTTKSCQGYTSPDKTQNSQTLKILFKEEISKFEIKSALLKNLTGSVNGWFLNIMASGTPGTCQCFKKKNLSRTSTTRRV